MSDIAQVKDIVPRIQYTATAGQTVFVYPFPIFDAGDIVVEQNGTVLTLSTDYTVSGVAAEDGGDITLTSGASSGDIMTIYRDMALNRLIDYQQNGDFLAANVNRDFDRLWLSLQQLQGGADAGEGVGRAWRASPDDTLADAELVIADLATRAGRIVGFDSNGKFSYSTASISSDPSQIYSSVLAMQNDSNLTVGQFVRTVGYTVQGDYGNNDYEIVAAGAGAADGGRFIDLPGSGLQAKGLFPDGIITLVQFGAQALETFDSATAFQNAINYLKDLGGGELLIPAGTYGLGSTVVIDSSAIIVRGQGAAGTAFNDLSGFTNRGTLLRYTGAGSEPVIDVGNGANFFTGVVLENFAIDGKGATGVIGFRLNGGPINCRFEGLSLFDTAKGAEVLGTTGQASFNNRFINCTFEHFDDYGLDIFQDGNGPVVERCKFINFRTFGAAPVASLRISSATGTGEDVHGIVVTGNSFGSQNVLHHILIEDAQGVFLAGNEIETSGNSTVTADSLVKLGNAAEATVVLGLTMVANRMIGNAKADLAIDLDNVRGGFISGNYMAVASFLVTPIIRNGTSDELTILSNFSGATFADEIGDLSGIDFYVDPVNSQPTFGNGVTLPLGFSYTANNVVTDRTYNVNTVTLEELANVVGTLITDLKTTKLIQ